VSGLDVQDSLSDGMSVVAPGSAKGQGTLAGTVLEEVRVTGTGLGAPGRPGLWIRDDAVGGLILLRSQVGEVRNDSKNFRIHPMPAAGK
jgi:hypothetical protein